MEKSLKADSMLLLVTLCWGISYYLMNLCLQDMGAFTLNSIRFLGAFAVAILLTFPRFKKITKETLGYSLVVGFILMIVYVGATFGVQYTSLSNSGFLCALTVVFVPIISFIFLKKRPEKKIIFAVLLCLVGIALLTLENNFSINMSHLKGDLLCIMCAVAYAFDLLITERAVAHKKVDAFQLGVFQLGVTGAFNLLFAFMFEQPHLPSSNNVWFAVIFLSIFCTGIAFIVQTLAQQYTTAVHVGIIFTLEPIFAGIAAFLIVGEVLSFKSYIGAILMIASLFITEIDFSSIRSKMNNKKHHEII